MNIQNPARSCNVPRAQKRCATPDPTSVQVVHINGAKVDCDFPGWPTLHHLALTNNVAIHRDGARVLMFVVSPAHSIEFWGHA